MELREKIVDILADAYADGAAGSHPNTHRHSKRILALITPKDIEWVGDCDLRKYYIGSKDGYHDNYNCPKCGRSDGKITRPATFEEVMEVLSEYMKITHNFSEIMNGRVSKKGVESVSVALIDLNRYANQALNIKDGQLIIKGD